VSEQLDRAAAALRRHQLDAALLVTPPNVTYAGGYEVPLPGGFVTEWTGWLPAFALVRADATGMLAVPDDLLAHARTSSWLDVVSFDSLGHFEPTDPLGVWRSALDSADLRGARIGIEPVLPQAALPALAGSILGDAVRPLAEARAIKTRPELEKLRRAVAAADAGQRKLLELAPAAPGMDELELWSEVRAAMQSAAGAAVAIVGTLATGARTALVESGGPEARRIVAGDPGLLDTGARVDGYWSDCANTVVFGAEPTPEQRRYLAAARSACESAIARLRPGASCSEPSDAIRETLERAGLAPAHYAGHQVGTSPNEPPRLLPFADERIEPGMVYAVEAGAYAGPGGTIGARCEKVALVTEDEPEVLSSFTWE
jgi:Xaa-Pro aminopeptidase